MLEKEYDFSKLQVKGISPYVINKLKLNVIDKIAIIQVPDVYELGMLFLRYQEYYESPNPLFNRKPFTIIDFMNWYRKEMNLKKFTYPEDYIGYNIPLKHVAACYGVTTDYNEYDRIMYMLLVEMAALNVEYVIGVPKYIEDKLDSTFKHEIAHALWYTQPEYRLQMELLISKMSSKQRKALVEVFKTLMYGTEHYDDEIQAYLSTGLHGEMRKIAGIKKLEDNFKPVFKLYYREFSKKLQKK